MREKSRDDLFDDGQLAKSVYLRQMTAMKEILNFGEVKFGDRNSTQYKYFKKVVMNAIYEGMTETFKAWEREGVIEKCSCGTSIRNGYKECEHCSGAGFCNVGSFNDWFSSTEDSSEQ